MCQGPDQCPFHEAMAVPVDQPPPRVDPDLWRRMLDRHPPDIARDRFAKMLRRDLLSPEVPEWVLRLMRDPERRPEPLPKPWELRAHRDSLGRRIRGLRVAAGVTQMQLAVATGVSQAMISRVESGETLPSIHLFVRLAEVLGVAYGELLARGR